MNTILEQNRKEIIQLCQQHKVKELYAFGSVVRDDFTAESDIDLLVAFNDSIQDLKKRITNEEKLKKRLKELLNKEIDLIPISSLKNKYLKHFINQEKKLLYAEA